jgi:hypothetical protein
LLLFAILAMIASEDGKKGEEETRTIILILRVTFPSMIHIVSGFIFLFIYFFFLPRHHCGMDFGHVESGK